MFFDGHTTEELLRRRCDERSSSAAACLRRGDAGAPPPPQLAMQRRAKLGQALSIHQLRWVQEALSCLQSFIGCRAQLSGLPTATVP